MSTEVIASVVEDQLSSRSNSNTDKNSSEQQFDSRNDRSSFDTALHSRRRAKSLDDSAKTVSAIGLSSLNNKSEANGGDGGGRERQHVDFENASQNDNQIECN
jgi:hypothetical protein